MSTTCSTLYASAVRPSLSLLISASGSAGLFQSSLLIFFLRYRSNRNNAAASGAHVVVAGVAPYDQLHGRIGLQRCRIYSHRLALDQSSFCQLFQNPVYYQLVKLASSNRRVRKIVT